VKKLKAERRKQKAEIGKAENRKQKSGKQKAQI
jgi:hypothetical protein